MFSSGALIEDLTHNFFLETVARQNKLRAGLPKEPSGEINVPA